MRRQQASAQGAQIDIPLLSRILSEYAGFDNFNQFYKSAVPHELESVPYTMLPMKDGPKHGSKSPGQGNDFFGATDASRTANMNQQHHRAGGTSSPPNQRGGL